MYEHTLTPSDVPRPSVSYTDCCRKATSVGYCEFRPPRALDRLRIGTIQQMPYTKTLPYYQRIHQIAFSSGSFGKQYQNYCGGDQHNPKNFCKDSATFSVPTFCRLPDLQPMDTSLLNDAKLALSEDFSNAKAALAVTAIEARSTWEAVSNRLNKIIRAMWSIKSGRFRDAATTMGYTGKLVRDSRQMAADRLEYAYMWAPTIGEVRGLAEAAAGRIAMIAAQPSVSKKRKRVTFSTPSPAVDVYNYYFGIDYILRQTGGSDTHSQTASVWARARLRDANLRTLDQLGLVNPLLVGWELIPFSFIIDQFVPIGTYLASFSAYAGWIVEDAGGSFENVCSRSAKVKIESFTSGAFAENREYNRFNFADGNHGTIEPEFPLTSLSISQSFNRLLNNIALGRLVLTRH